MNVRASLLLLALAVAVSGCSILNDSQTGITTPTTGASTTLTGSWSGSASDSTGSTFGTSASGAVLWTILQSGNQLTGNIAIRGASGTGERPTISGTLSGNTVTFVVTIPAGSVSDCSSTASGTLTLTANGNFMAGSYSGTGSCAGEFSNGHITLSRMVATDGGTQ